MSHVSGPLEPPSHPVVDRSPLLTLLSRRPKQVTVRNKRQTPTSVLYHLRITGKRLIHLLRGCLPESKEEIVVVRGVSVFWSSVELSVDQVGKGRSETGREFGGSVYRDKTSTIFDVIVLNS